MSNLRKTSGGKPENLRIPPEASGGKTASLRTFRATPGGQTPEVPDMRQPEDCANLHHLRRLLTPNPFHSKINCATTTKLATNLHLDTSGGSQTQAPEDIRSFQSGASGGSRFSV